MRFNYTIELTPVSAVLAKPDEMEHKLLGIIAVAMAKHLEEIQRDGWSYDGSYRIVSNGR